MTLLKDEVLQFTVSYEKILNRISDIQPVKYASSRNYIDGAVTYLSPYISRGVISTKQVLEAVLSCGYKPDQIEKFIQELAWRDYWQQVWIAKGDAIDSDLKKPQERVSNQGISEAVVVAKTGISAIDSAINDFYKTGYLHNHVRMYIAAICCNMGQSHWQYPAKWMYYHLLDGDWASNTLSWQWVAGSNSNKKYVANQENINKYCHTKQNGTFLDVDYSEFATMDVPKELAITINEKYSTPLPKKLPIVVHESIPSYIYNFYNLNPLWDSEIQANRILLLEPSVFEKYPISQKSVDFMLALANNIEDIQVFVGEFHELTTQYNLSDIHFKEHPLNQQYKGTEVPRNWMFEVTGYFPSFFGFWKKCKKQLKY